VARLHEPMRAQVRREAISLSRAREGRQCWTGSGGGIATALQAAETNVAGRPAAQRPRFPRWPCSAPGSRAARVQGLSTPMYAAGDCNDPREEPLFDPVKQAMEYDPRSKYMTWVPELRGAIGPEEAGAEGMMGVFQRGGSTRWSRADFIFEVWSGSTTRWRELISS
jgi:hypothetical protein